MISQEICYYNHKCDLAFNPLYFSTLYKRLVKITHHLLSHFFTIDVRVPRMSYSMTSTKIEFDLTPYLEMIISAILVTRQIFKLLS